LEMN